MYQSGQFGHYLGFWEDWLERDPYGYQRKTDEGVSLPNVKETMMTLYTVAEIFLFASRLASNKIFDNTSHVSIQLKNTNNRKLIVDDSMRYLHDNYTCKYEPIKIEKDITLEDILTNSQELSLQTTFEIFQKFNWILKDDSKEGIRKDQEKFLKRLV